MMRIAQLAAASGLTIDTIRFYEKAGLLSTEHFTRKPNGYRDYHEAALRRLILIRQGQSAGLTLREMSALIGLWEADALSNEQKRLFFLEKLEALEARIQELQDIRQYILSKLESMGE